MNVTLTGTGSLMPILGLGTYKITGQDTIFNVLNAALSIGYRSIDTAAVYRNESDIGSSLKTLLPKHKLQRSDIFITSKLAPRDQGKNKCLQAAMQSLKNLDVDYLDLYLIHWPGVHGLKPDDPRHKIMRAESWNDMEQLYKNGKLKNIGVSNYSVKHLKELLSHCSVRPAVLQVEYHPFYIQHDLLKFCQQENIHLQAYSSLGGTTSEKPLLENPVVIKVASRNKRSPAQVLLHWALQQNVGIIPKASSKEHLADNFNVLTFELSEDDMKQLNKLDKQEKFSWDPALIA